MSFPFSTDNISRTPKNNLFVFSTYLLTLFAATNR